MAMNAGTRKTATGRLGWDFLAANGPRKKRARKPNQITGKTRLEKKVLREEIRCMGARGFRVFQIEPDLASLARSGSLTGRAVRRMSRDGSPAGGMQE